MGWYSKDVGLKGLEQSDHVYLSQNKIVFRPNINMIKLYYKQDFIEDVQTVFKMFTI